MSDKKILYKISEIVKNQEYIPNWNEYFISLAILISSRSTCSRLKVGCIIVDQKNRIISTGYNGFISKINILVL